MDERDFLLIQGCVLLCQNKRKHSKANHRHFTLMHSCFANFSPWSSVYLYITFLCRFNCSDVPVTSFCHTQNSSVHVYCDDFKCVVMYWKVITKNHDLRYTWPSVSNRCSQQVWKCPFFLLVLQAPLGILRSPGVSLKPEEVEGHNKENWNFGL